MRKAGSKDKLIDLYSRIPDYDQVKHLGNSDFINTLEKLKEEFRQCRASLQELDSDVEYISKQTSKILNISKADDTFTKEGGAWKKKNINMVRKDANLYSSFQPPQAQSLVIRHRAFGSNEDNSDPKNSYLSIRSCALHKSTELNSVQDFKSIETRRWENLKSDRNYDDYAEDFELCSEGLSTPESGISRWSSSPEIYRRDREVSPPSNVERRLLLRKAINNSAPSIPDVDDKPKLFKAHPVPDHVHKPLFDYIMLKNKRRSMRVREKSKQRLLSQMKPFSFAHDSKSKTPAAHGMSSAKAYEPLNNSRPTKKSRNHSLNGGLKNKLDHHTFRAHPAPPRTRALLAAIRLREQQEYRELKKKLRAEALMKSASLPPSMAARDQVSKSHCSRLEDLLMRYNDGGGRSARQIRESSADTFTEDDDLTDDDILRKSKSGIRRKLASRKRQSRNFTPYGELRFPHSSVTDKIFETTSNDNHASRLRIQAAKAREQIRLKLEEEELMRQMKMDKKRQRLRDTHSMAWRVARSYSSSQDIAMRRQLRMAAAILERENYRREMSGMISRVRSAPLLLEGVRERRSEPCKKHREEMPSSGRIMTKSPNKLSSPRHTYNRVRSGWRLGREDTDKSETAAVAEGSLTNSDNESVKNLELDDEEHDKVAGVEEHLRENRRGNGSQGSSHGRGSIGSGNGKENSPLNIDQDAEEPCNNEYEDDAFESCE